MKKTIHKTMLAGVAASAILMAVAPASFALDYYGGVAGGASFLSVKDDATFVYGSSYGGIPDTSNSVTGSTTGMTGEVYLGLAGQPMGRFDLGTELNFTGFSGSANTVIPGVLGVTQTEATYDSKINYAFGISVLPGFVVSDKTLLFSRIGIDYANFKSTSSSDSSGDLFTSPVKENVAALRLGLGVEHFITSNLSLRAEGDYWYLNKVNNSLNDSFNDLQLNQDYNASSITAMLGLTYHFGAQSDTTAK